MSASRFDISRLSQRLLSAPQPMPDAHELVPDWKPEMPPVRDPVPAAVMIALVHRGDQFGVLYTERSSQLRNHSGQISFPGGKIDPGDEGPGEAAIREAGEEVDMRAQDVTILGYMPHYFTGTNYLITPVVTLVEPSAPFAPNPGEVEAIFEIPLNRLMMAQSYGTFRVKRRGVEHSTWQVDHEGHVIWGITGNLTRQFYELALSEGA